MSAQISVVIIRPESVPNYFIFVDFLLYSDEYFDNELTEFVVSGCLSFCMCFWKMSKIMESRIAEADEARLAAEKEKLKKEESARAALAEQEAVMEKVVQESKILQEAAEENSKVFYFSEHVR